MIRPPLRRLLWVALAAAWLTAFISTHIPAERVPTLPASDKLLHMATYAGLALIYWLTLAAHPVRGLRRVGLVIASLLAYAVFDEITQPLVNRYASLADGLADAAGAVIAVTLCEVGAWVRRRRAPGA
ncbi:MAG: VanZ family protein [Planctomycetes bacterium]|nr:VanZ family protein [Planctomycetota bacterium]